MSCSDLFLPLERERKLCDVLWLCLVCTHWLKDIHKSQTNCPWASSMYQKVKGICRDSSNWSKSKGQQHPFGPCSSTVRPMNLQTPEIQPHNHTGPKAQARRCDKGCQPHPKIWCVPDWPISFCLGGADPTWHSKHTSVWGLRKAAAWFSLHMKRSKIAFITWQNHGLFPQLLSRSY